MDDRESPLIPGLPNAAELTVRINAMFGSQEQLWKYLEDRLLAFTGVWERDSRSIGEVLHAHIVVEHFLDKYLRKAHPEIEFDKWQLSYERKVFLIPKSDVQLNRAVPGLRALGTIRNNLSHKLHFGVSKNDVQAMVNVAEYKAMRTSGATQSPMDFNSATPEAIVLDFAKWIASTLQTMTDPDQGKLELLFDLSRNIDGTPALPRKNDGAPGSVGTKRRLFGDT